MRDKLSGNFNMARGEAIFLLFFLKLTKLKLRQARVEMFRCSVTICNYPNKIDWALDGVFPEGSGRDGDNAVWSVVIGY